MPEGNYESKMLPDVAAGVESRNSSSSQKNSQSQIPRQRKLDKQVPLVMGLSVVFAIIFALIHHFFYRYWNKRVVGSNSEQQWIIRGGTVFAFGFKTALVTGSGAAYVQYLWMTMRDRPFRVKEIDSMFSVLTDALKFRHLTFWFRVPLLAIVAIITWLIPLAAIITPGTLIVSPILHSSSTTQIVPSLDFQNNADMYGSVLQGAGTGSFDRATDEAIRVALGSATSGTILPMSPPALNSSYTYEFYGPALRCEKANDTEFQFFDNLAQNYSSSSGGKALTYFSWVPSNIDNSNNNIPSFNQSDFSLPIDISSSTNGSQVNVFLACTYNQDVSTVSSCKSPVLLYCTLRNVSYTVNFAFESGQQTMSIDSAGNGDPVNQWNSYFAETTVRSITNKTLSYLSVMFAFNSIITGSIDYGDSVAAWAVQSTMIQSTNLAPLLASPNNETIGSALEDLFQNITFSLFSSNRFLADATNASRAVSSNVTTQLTQNIYVYNPLDLYLAYGLTLVSALICICIGSLALTGNGVSFSDEFTTILRATRNPELDHLVAEGECNGADPTPKHTAEALLSYNLRDDRKAGFQLSQGPQVSAPIPP